MQVFEGPTRWVLLSDKGQSHESICVYTHYLSSALAQCLMIVRAHNRPNA
jgi:hypothetical protein